MQEGRIFVFNRKGKHLHNFMRKGNSGEEFVFANRVRIDDKAEEIFVLDTRNKVLVYALDGKFKRVLNIPKDMQADDLWNYDDEWLLSYDSYNLDRTGMPCSEQPFFLLSKKDGSIKRIDVTVADNLIAYDFNGRHLPDEAIYLPNVPSWKEVCLNGNKDSVLVFVSPKEAGYLVRFRERIEQEEDNYVCWQQDLKGNVSQGISADRRVMPKEANLYNRTLVSNKNWTLMMYFQEMNMNPEINKEQIKQELSEMLMKAVKK